MDDLGEAASSGGGASVDPAASRPPMVATVFVEGVLGHAVAATVHRFILGELIYDPTPGATLPAWRPMINLAVPHQALPGLIENLQKAYDSLNARAEKNAEEEE